MKLNDFKTIYVNVAFFMEVGFVKSRRKILSLFMASEHEELVFYFLFLLPGGF